MKLTVLFMCFSFGMIHATNTYSQSAVLSLDINNMSVQTVLDVIEDQSEFNFFYNNKQVNTERLVSVKRQNANVFAVLDEIFANTNVIYKVLDRSIILSTEKTGAFSSQQNNGKRIRGSVIDNTGEPVIGANVVEKGTTNGTTTTAEGDFALIVSPDAVLLITYVGYLPQEIPVGNQTEFRITLSEDTKALEEVVV
ncbi:MAG: carboxypeptidase-like regulatory domain-containing protein, partial [Tannerella sp.]|nr:carboxypeptidase-like regulatory domain-containing protein [Tannerella sp.]